MSPDVLRIFVSSPGDVGEERVMTERVVQRLQGEFGQSVKLEPILWEHEPMRATQHPQEQIPLPSECDIVVCLLWSRLGTRLPDQVSAAGKTGTEWEFDVAEESFKANGTPDLLVYRKTLAPLADVRDQPAWAEKTKQWASLQEFIDRKCKTDKGECRAVFKPFNELSQFEDLLERDLRKLIQERLKLTPHAEKTWHHAPFRGLEVFDYEHAPIFFGRTRSIGAIREALVQQSAHGCAFVLVFGMSGVGKSSLVRAGVLPTITQPGVIEGVGLWRWCVFRPSDATGDLCDGLASALMAPEALPELAEVGVDARALAKLLREAPEQAALPIGVGLKRAAETIAAAEHLLKPLVTRLALVVDQMEELFSSDRVTEAQRIGFVKALSALARSGHVWIIGTMRSDFYPRCAEIPELAALKAGAGQFDLLPPTAPQLAQMIGDPARAAGLRFEEKTTGERLDHVLQETALRDPQALPLLEFTLAELYKACSKDKPPSEPVVLTFAAYEQLGGMEGALARRAEEEFAKLPANVQAALPAVFRALVTVRQGEDEAIVAQPVLREVFAAAADQDALVEAFIQARLFVSDRTSVEQKAMVRLAHEALLRCWPRLVQWLAANREFLRIRVRVSEEAKRWQNEGRLPELLLHPGKPLAEGEFLLAQQQELDHDVVAFIDLSRQSAARTRRWRRMAVAASVLLLVAPLVVFAVMQEENLRTEAANAKKIADYAHDMLNLAESEKMARKKADENARGQQKAREEAVKQKRLSDRRLYVSKMLLVQQAWENVRIDVMRDLLTSLIPRNKDDEDYREFEWYYWWRLCHSEIATLRHEHDVVAVDYSPDGKLLASATRELGSRRGSVQVWDVTIRKIRAVLPAEAADAHIHRSPFCLAFHPDGKRLAITYSYDGTNNKLWAQTIWWNWVTGETTEITREGGFPNGLAISPDGKWLATRTSWGALKLWSTETKENRVLEKGPGNLNTLIRAELAFSSDSKSLAAVSPSNTIRVFPIKDPKGKINVLSGKDFVAFSPDNRFILTGDTEAGSMTVMEWPLAKQTNKLRGHQDLLMCACFSQDGKYVASVSWDKTIRVWRADHEFFFGTDPKPMQVLKGHLNYVFAAVFSPDNHTLATGSTDQTVKIWDIQRPPEYEIAKTPPGYYPAAAGLHAAVDQFSKKQVKYFRDASPKEIFVLDGFKEMITAQAFSLDGKWLITGGGQGDRFLNKGEVPKRDLGVELLLWDLAQGKQKHSLQGHTARIYRIAVSDDSKTVITASYDRTIRLWDIATGKQINLVSDVEYIYSIALSPLGHHLAVGADLGADFQIRVFDLATAKELPPLSGHTHFVERIAFHPDGKRLASFSADKSVKIWNLESSQEEKHLKNHTGFADGLVFNAKGTRMASLSSDSKGNTIIVWDTSSYQELLVLKAPGDRLFGLAFGPNDDTLLSGGVIWHTHPKKRIE